MKVAVTGASGFVGQYVVAELMKLKIAPTLVVRSELTFPDALANYNTVTIDIQNPPPHSYELIGSPDVLIHLAWGGLPNYKSLHHFEEELPHQYQFLKKLILSGLPNLVVTGTCFEYGMQSGSLSEAQNCFPNNPYGFAKNSLRCQIDYLRQKKEINLTWARLFYLHGSGQSKNSLLPQLKQAVDRGETIFNMSGGEQLRDYLPVAEAAKYLVLLAKSNQDNGIVNICSGTPISVRKLVEEYVEANDWTIDINLGHYPYPDYEPMAFWGNREKLDRCLNRS